jgi:tetratricopeptide (TPR) repeat protein
MSLAGRLFISDHLQKSSESLLQTYYADPSQRFSAAGDASLSLARSQLKTALRITPASDPELHLRRGSLFAILANVLMSRRDQALQAGTEPAEMLHAEQMAGLLYRSAFQELKTAQETGAEYFRTHFDLALVHKGLAALAPDPKTQRIHEQAYEWELRQSHRFNPSFDAATRFLLDYFESKRPPADVELSAWRQSLLKHAPSQYAERYLEPLGESMKRDDFGQALWLLNVLGMDDPDEPLYAYSAALVLARQGEPRLAKASLANAKKSFPDYPLYLDFAANVAFGSGDWEEARELAEQAINEGEDAAPGRDIPMMEAVRAFAAEQGGYENAEKLIARVRRIAFESPPDVAVRWLDSAINALLNMPADQVPDAVERALPFMRRRAEIPNPAPDATFMVPLARDAAAKNNLDQAQAYLKEALIAQPGYSEALDLIDEIFGADSPEAGRIPAEAATERRARDQAERQKSFQALMDNQGF